MYSAKRRPSRRRLRHQLVRAVLDDNIAVADTLWSLGARLKRGNDVYNDHDDHDAAGALFIKACKAGSRHGAFWVYHMVRFAPFARVFIHDTKLFVVEAAFLEACRKRRWFIASWLVHFICVLTPVRAWLLACQYTSNRVINVWQHVVMTTCHHRPWLAPHLYSGSLRMGLQFLYHQLQADAIVWIHENVEDVWDIPPLWRVWLFENALMVKQASEPEYVYLQLWKCFPLCGWPRECIIHKECHWCHCMACAHDLYSRLLNLQDRAARCNMPLLRHRIIQDTGVCHISVEDFHAMVRMSRMKITWMSCVLRGIFSRQDAHIILQ